MAVYGKADFYMISLIAHSMFTIYYLHAGNF